MGSHFLSTVCLCFVWESCKDLGSHWDKTCDPGDVHLVSQLIAMKKGQSFAAECYGGGEGRLALPRRRHANAEDATEAGEEASMEVATLEGTLGARLLVGRPQLLIRACSFSKFWRRQLSLWGNHWFTLHHLPDPGAVGKANSPLHPTGFPVPC